MTSQPFLGDLHRRGEWNGVEVRRAHHAPPESVFDTVMYTVGRRSPPLMTHHVTEHVTGHVTSLARVLHGGVGRSERQEVVGCSAITSLPTISNRPWPQVSSR